MRGQHTLAEQLLHTYKPQVSTIYTLQIPRYSLGRGNYSKVKSMSHIDTAHLQPLTNVSTKYQLPTSIGIESHAEDRYRMKI